MPLINRLTALIAVILVAGASALALTAPTAYAEDPPAAAAATPVPPPAVAEKTTEAVDNPYGLDALWKGGDFVARGTLVILVIMSMGSWYIMFTKVYEQYQMMRQANDVRKSFWTAASLQQGAEELKKGSPFRYIAESSLQATEHHEGKLVEQIDRYTWVSNAIGRSVENVQSRLQDGLAFLATVGSTAPFVGLFGTVWGIMDSFVGISKAQTTNLAVVAPGIAEALLATAIGLAAAIPAVIIYNHFSRATKAYLEYVGRGSGAVGRLLSRDLDRSRDRLLARAAE
jgi:biopolymer transport protein ExbB